MAGLIELPVAKGHLRVTDADHDADIQLKADQASAIVVDYLKSQADPNWTPQTVNLIVQSAILDVLTCLYEHRGDDFGIGNPDEHMWNAIGRRLARLRDPALA